MKFDRWNSSLKWAEINDLASFSLAILSGFLVVLFLPGLVSWWKAVFLGGAVSLGLLAIVSAVRSAAILIVAAIREDRQ